MTITVTAPPQSPREMTTKYIQVLYGQSLFEFARQLERELSSLQVVSEIAEDVLQQNQLCQ